MEEISDDLVSSSFSGTCVRIGNKWWREVKESDLSLHNNDDKESLRLSVDECKQIDSLLYHGLVKSQAVDKLKTL